MMLGIKILMSVRKCRSMGDELDFVADPQNLNKIMKMIETKLAEIRTGKEKGIYQTQRAVVKGDFSEK